MGSEPELSPDDPLGLERAERKIRIEKLRHEIKEVTGEEMLAGKPEECNPELEEAFLEQVLELETHAR
jgi:predicted deacetylase